MAEYIFGAMAVISAVYYIYVESKTCGSAEIKEFWIISAFIFSYFWFYEKFLVGKSVYFAAAFWVFLSLVSVFILIFVFFIAASFFIPKREAKGTIILFGCDISSFPEKIYEKRILLAENILLSCDCRIILSGKGKTGEAAFARDRLLSRGVPSVRMILEDKSDTTLQNIINTYRIAKDGVFVTSRFHSVRVYIMTRYLFPEKTVKIICSGGEGFLFIHLFVREVICLFVDIFSGRLCRAKKAFQK